MTIRPMLQTDIPAAAELYISYYNTCENACWTPSTAYKRIHQVWSHCDPLCLMAEENGRLLGFSIGHFEQYDDLVAFDLVEIVLAQDCQNCGLGTRFLQEIETQAKAMGAAMIQLSAVNSPRHIHFYTKLGYRTCSNLVLKSKFL